MLEPHLCFYCSQPSHDHCEGSSRCSRDPAELGDELACRLLTRSALEHILPWEMLSWNNSLLFSNNTVLIFGGHTQQRDLSVAQGQRLFIPPNTLGALFSKSPILNWKNGPQDEFGAAACTRRADCILLSGLKGARGGQPLKLDQTANSGAGRAVCFICPQSSQPFIIQRTLRNYQCAFNNTLTGFPAHPLRWADVHVCGTWVTLFSGSIVHTRGTNTLSLSRGWSPWCWPLHLQLYFLRSWHFKDSEQLNKLEGPCRADI